MSSETNSNPDSTPTGELEAKMILQRYLTPGENLLWSDKPLTRWKQDLKGMWLVLALFLLFFLFPVVNFIVYTTNTDKSETADLPPAQQETLPQKQTHSSPAAVIIVSAFMAAFLSLWCYLMFRGMGGQKLLNLLSLSKTYYGLTDDRLLMVSGKKEFRVLSYHLRCVQDLRLREEPDGVGTINLGPKDRFNNPFQAEDAPPLILKNIPRAAQVFSLIYKAQNKLLRL